MPDRGAGAAGAYGSAEGGMWPGGVVRLYVPAEGWQERGGRCNL